MLRFARFHFYLALIHSKYDYKGRIPEFEIEYTMEICTQLCRQYSCISESQ